MPTITAKLQIRRDTAQNWTTINPILAAGEPGLELDTGKFKFGTGNLLWNNLPYATVLPTSASPTALLTALKQVDGSGSGLDAGLLEGTQKSDLLIAAKSVIPTTLLEVGKLLSITTNLTTPTALVLNGVYYVYNATDTTLTLFAGIGVVLRIAGTTTTGSCALLPRGLYSIWAISTSEALVSLGGC